MKTIITLSSAIALSLCAQASFAGYGYGMGFGQKAERSERQQARIEKRVAKMMERFDTNKDGQITLDEAQAVSTVRFNQMDADGNGGVSLEEFIAAKKQPRRSRRNDSSKTAVDSPASPDDGAAQSRRDQRQNGKCNKRHGKNKGKYLEARFNNLDSDQNGQISVDEFTANMRLFNKFDTNNDGVITGEELSSQKNRRR
jgi:hypothetical protein